MKKKSDENNSDLQNSEKLLKRTKGKLVESEQKFRNIINNLDEAYSALRSTAHYWSTIRP